MGKQQVRSQKRTKDEYSLLLQRVKTAVISDTCQMLGAVGVTLSATCLKIMALSIALKLNLYL